jgi:hypothetical protein
METTYQGSCHCGNVKFEVTADIDHLRICDCSLCHKRGALNFRVEDSQLKRITPLEEMTLYQWHTKTAKDYFCPTCGILPYRRPRTAPDLWTVNVRCLAGIDVNEIPKEHLTGSKLS